MTLMHVATHDDLVLTYDTDDVEDMTIFAPRDVHQVGATEHGYPLRELDQEGLHLGIDFKPGKGSRWITRAEAALPDLRRSGEMLRAALEAEGIPAEVAARVWNRFFYGHPDGIEAAPTRDAAAELAQQALHERSVAALLAAGIDPDPTKWEKGAGDE